MLAFLKRWFAPRQRAVSYEDGRNGGLLGTVTETGVSVTVDTALTSSPVFGAVRLISTAAASLPLTVYRKLPDDGREAAGEHPVYGMLHDSPNDESVPSILWAAFYANLLLEGRGAFEIERDGAGHPLALWHIPGSAIHPARDQAGQLYYAVNTTQGVQPLLPEHCFYVPYFTLDGVSGKGIIEYARECIGLNKAMETGAGAFFKNITAPGGAIEAPTGLSDQAVTNIRKSVEAANSGTGKVGRLLFLQDGLKYVPYTVNNDQAQWLEGRQFGVQEVARFFNLSPTKLADLGRATWSNIESENTSFIENTLRPILTPVEQEARKKLFTPAERQTLYVEANMEGRLRGLTSERYAAYSTAITAGFMLPSEARKKENWPAIPGIDDRPRPGAPTTPPTPPSAPDGNPESGDPADG